MDFYTPLKEFDQFNSPDFFYLRNFILAYIPLMLSIILFTFKNFTHKNIIWWLVFLAFLIFLPNAPYALTDCVHLISDFVMFKSKYFVFFILLPIYVIYFILCIESFTISLFLLCRYLVNNNLKKWIISVEIIIMLACSLGIYLGRFQRLNSWNIVTNINKLSTTVISDLTNIVSLFYVIIIFCLLYLFYYMFKHLNILLLRSI